MGCTGQAHIHSRPCVEFAQALRTCRDLSQIDSCQKQQQSLHCLRGTSIFAVVQEKAVVNLTVKCLQCGILVNIW
jgi:hypothetical protein